MVYETLKPNMKMNRI